MQLTHMELLLGYILKPGQYKPIMLDHAEWTLPCYCHQN